MPQITVTTTVRTILQVPEGVSIEQVRHLALPNLSEGEEATDSVMAFQISELNTVYLGDADPIATSVEHSISEGAA